MALKDFAFNVLNKDKYARHGLIETHRGNIKTPALCQLEHRQLLKRAQLMI